eukprot:TRINITY_DN9770_c0_g1_i1.p1 TRINITY_DN9770_c0_g1~~TRINITY_DN9770_c0_g1_i1.p1  ORF type:complete len:413 (-),score=107.78 TRINITY_DN9770_c0_g1_i1:143-1381(-)
MVKETKLYELLNVSPDASPEDIRRSYKRLAVQFHPDKNPDPSAAEKFKDISRAYEVLSDEDKRRMYDRHGEAALDGDGGGGGASAHDIFAQFFGGGSPFDSMFGGGMGRERGERRGKEVVHALPVTLEELYNGKTKKLSLNKQVICSVCAGSGSKKKGKSSTCSDCRGQGIKLVIRQMGPMIQQMQTTCPSCNGEGTQISAKDRCGTCGGNRVAQEKKILEVHVEKGMRHNEKVTFSREGDQHPDIKIPGDVIIVLQERKHERFERRDSDLCMSRTITLKEALCGCSFTVTHLDGRTLLRRTTPGQVVKPGSVLAVPNEGMPKHRNPFDKGYLLIQFDVEMPPELPASVLTKLDQLLPGPPMGSLPSGATEAEECFLHPYTQSAGGDRRRGRQPQEESDDEDGGQRAQCVHQ